MGMQAEANALLPGIVELADERLQAGGGPGAFFHLLEILAYDFRDISTGLPTIIDCCRTLWWIAASVVVSCGLRPSDDLRVLGLPTMTLRNEACCCGSGIKTKNCKHPEPQSVGAELMMRRQD